MNLLPPKFKCSFFGGIKSKPAFEFVVIKFHQNIRQTEFITECFGAESLTPRKNILRGKIFVLLLLIKLLKKGKIFRRG